MPVLLLTLLSAGLYVLNHIYRLGDGWTTYCYLFLLGCLFVIPLVYTKRLWFTGGMHWMGNTTFFFTHTFIPTHTTEQGMNANVTLIVCILLYLPVVAYTVRRNVREKYTSINIVKSTN